MRIRVLGGGVVGVTSAWYLAADGHDVTLVDRAAGPALEKELIEFCGRHLARQKVPRSIDYETELPRLPTGKLYKRLLRDRYWQGRDSKIV